MLRRTESLSDGLRPYYGVWKRGCLSITGDHTRRFAYLRAVNGVRHLGFTLARTALEVAAKNGVNLWGCVFWTERRFLLFTGEFLEYVYRPDLVIYSPR